MKPILLVGAPNTGKTQLFNLLTNSQQKIANFPGVTTEVVEAKFLHNPSYTVFDLPGLISFSQQNDSEEKIAKQFLLNSINTQNATILYVFDASRLRKSISLCLKVQQLCVRYKTPFIAVANMCDRPNSITQHQLKKLSRLLNTEIIPISSRKKQGISSLSLSINSALMPSDIPLEDEPFINARAATIYQQIQIKSEVVKGADSILLNSFFGWSFLLVVLFAAFQLVFVLATPLMDGLEYLLSLLAVFITKPLVNPLAFDFVNDALFGGFGAFLVFLPQVLLLTFFISLLEESGYLARAAVLCHKSFAKLGLNGKAIIPLVTASACAIPAIYSSRIMGDSKSRLLSMLAIPLIPCSARLPVYGLMIAVLVPEDYLWGFISMRGLLFLAIYLLGLFFAFAVLVLANWYLKPPPKPLIIELPQLQRPRFLRAFTSSFTKSLSVVKKVAFIIFSTCLLVWVLGYFPNNGDLSSSWLAYLGVILEPLFAPLGLDWRYGIALITAFLAREVFVGTLGTLFAIGNPEIGSSLAVAISKEGLSTASAVAILILFAIAIQCVSTLAIIKSESQKRFLASYMFAGYAVFAYILAFIGYQLTLVFS